MVKGKGRGRYRLIGGLMYKFYVIFRPTDEGAKLPWWQRPFVWRRDFEHVEVLMQVGHLPMMVTSGVNGVWFHQFYDETDLAVGIDAKDVAQLYVDLKGHRVVEYGSDKESNVLNIAAVLPTCVSLAKFVIGHGGLAVTPYQLYKSLLKSGAKEMSPGKGAAKAQQAELTRQRKEAEEEQKRLAKDRQGEFLAQRRGARGRQSLITNLGGEQGTLGN